MNAIRRTCNVAVALLALTAVATIGTAWVQAGENGDTPMPPDGTNQSPSERGATNPKAAIYYSIAFTVGISCLSAGYAVGKVGAAALGAAAEKPELLGKAIIFVGLAEGIAIYGLIIGLFLINKL